MDCFIKVNTKVDICNQYKLHKAYPNPFNPSTTISFEIPALAHVTLEVYDILGKKVDIIANEQYSAGYYSVKWNATKHSSGVYIYRLQVGQYQFVNKCLLIR